MRRHATKQGAGWVFTGSGIFFRPRTSSLRCRKINSRLRRSDKFSGGRFAAVAQVPGKSSASHPVKPHPAHSRIGGRG